MKDLVELVQDDDRLKQERKRSKKNRDKYKGVSNEDYSRNYSKYVVRVLCASSSSFIENLIIKYLIINNVIHCQGQRCCHGYMTDELHVCMCFIDEVWL